jgi:N-acetyl-gamma-glutamyl-phosphate reductase
MPAPTLQPAVAGATGYGGFELTRLLLGHPRARKPLLLQRAGDGEAGDLAASYPQLAGSGGLPLEPFSWERLRQAGADVLFLCTPPELSREVAPEALARGLRVVDLSDAWRLNGAAQRAAYGIPELHAAAIAEAALVANAGCYATSIILALAPWLKAGLVARQRGIVCDAKSGVSGAGKQPTAKTHFVEVSDNLSAYAPFGHRHTGEILEQLALERSELQFTPHLLPIPRGILSTIYLTVRDGVTASELERCLREFYAGARFVRVFPAGTLPQIKYSLHSNYCDLGFAMEPEGRRVVLVSCLDNLLKGAAGQAVQNMNLMFGCGESEGLG